MRNPWISWLLFMGWIYVSSASSCDTDMAAACYADLVHYESLAFPLYGQDELRLDETCMNINASFECLQSYSDSCRGNPACAEECQDLIRDAYAFSLSTGLQRLTDELCGEDSAVRTVYLENYHCLEENADAFAACHNDSQMSQEYLNTLSGIDIIPSRCCFFTWYHDCFANVTRDNCGENARFYVSFAMHKLVGHIADQLCPSTNTSCWRPPLPPYEDGTWELDKDKPDQTQNDLDNSIGDVSKGSAAIGSCAVILMVLSYSVTVIFKRLL